MPVKMLLKRLEGFFVYRVLHVDDTPHRIALGVAIGIFVTWTPTMGFQMLITLALAWLLGANKLVGLPFVWISNPLTAGMIYYPNFALGRWLLGEQYEAPRFSQMLLVSGDSWIETWVLRVQAWWEATYHALAPLWLGSLIVATVLGMATYIAIRYAVVAYRKALQLRREHRMKIREERKARKGKRSRQQQES
ncbi:MAG: DUF2062 domain-containing protein [Phycisphaerae bacterium]